MPKINLQGKLFPETMPTIRLHLRKIVGAGTDVAKDILDEQLRLHGTSGAHWKSLPRRSSAPGEFPQEQTGTLLGSLAAKPANDPPDTRWLVGFENLDEDYLKRLEFAPADEGGRAPLSTVMEDDLTHAQMMRAADMVDKL